MEKTVRYCVKTGVRVIIGNFNEGTYIIGKLMEEQVMFQDDLTNKKGVKRRK